MATSKAAPAVPSLPAVQVLPARLSPVADTVAAGAGATDAVIGEAAAAVSTVTKTAPPVLSQVDKAVAAVDDAVASFEPQLSRLPIPVPAVRPMPNHLRGQKAPPAVPPAPAAASPDAGRPAAAAPPVAVAQAPAASAAEPSAVSGPPAASTTANSSAAPAAAEIREASTRGQTLAQLRMTSIGRPGATSAVQTDPLRVPSSRSGVKVIGLAAIHGESGSSHSKGSGGQAADVAAFWNALSQPTGERLLDAAVVLPPSPAFGPGSSPD